MSNAEVFFEVFRIPENARLLAGLLHPERASWSPDLRSTLDSPVGGANVLILCDSNCYMAILETDDDNVELATQQLSISLDELKQRIGGLSAIPGGSKGMQLEAYIVLPEKTNGTLPSSISVHDVTVPLRVLYLKAATGILGLYQEAIQSAVEKFDRNASAEGLWSNMEQAKVAYIKNYIEMRYVKYLTEMIFDMDSSEMANDEGPHT